MPKRFFKGGLKLGKYCMEMASWVQILEKAVGISIPTNAIGKRMNLSLLLL